MDLDDLPCFDRNEHCGNEVCGQCHEPNSILEVAKGREITRSRSCVVSISSQLDFESCAS